MIENLILENLLCNEDFAKAVLPFIDAEYFDSFEHTLLFKAIKEYTDEYRTVPTKDEIQVQVMDMKNIPQSTFDSAMDLLATFTAKGKAPSLDWLVRNTEKFCQDQALFNAVAKAAAIITEGGDEKGEIPELVRSALSVSFDSSIGHDYVNDIEARYKLLHQSSEYKMKLKHEVLNQILDGGLVKKILGIVSASTGAGKSLFLCDVAAGAVATGYNTLYITLEMAEERISERIDANLMNISLQDLKHVSLPEYTRKLKKGLGENPGRLIVKEYPTSGAGVSQFRALLNELKLKKSFTPDIIIVDYINICSSDRYKAGSTNSYTLVKSICEELRGMAIEYDVPILSATQLNREGTDNSDVGLKEISESHGLAMTADFLWAMIRSEELDEQNLVMFKQLKNRFSDMTMKLRFVMGIDRSKMKLYDVDETPNMMKAQGSPKQAPPPPAQPKREMAQLRTKIGNGNNSKFSGLKA